VRRGKQGVVVDLLSASQRGQLDRDGWLAVEGVLSAGAAAGLAERCRAALAASAGDPRIGDKPAAGTHRYVDLRDRMPGVEVMLDHPSIAAAVTAILGRPGQPGEMTFREPQPGFGEQQLHADALPLTSAFGPFTIVTCILALCDFTPHNGATGLVPGSHRRPDQQRQSAKADRMDGEIVLTGAAGTAFVFCGHVLHRGRRNDSQVGRPALQAIWR
jgi:hypothetical protein